MKRHLWKFGLTVLVLSLLCQIYRAQGQSQYIEKHYHGDIIPLDSFVVMDVGTYRGIRLGAQLYGQLSDVDRKIINKSDSIITSFNELVEANNRKMEVLMVGIERRDTVINELEALGQASYELNKKSVGYLEELNKKKNPLLSRGFFIGVAIGVIGMALIN